MASIKHYVDIDLQLNQLTNTLVEQLAADPGVVTEGRIYHNTVDNKTYVGSGGIYKPYAFEAALTAAITGLDWKASVVAATTANGALGTAYANASIIDGVTLATGDRILLKNQTIGADNGVYVVQAAGAPIRATDFDTSAELSGVAIVPIEGGTQAGTFRMDQSNPTLGTTALTFSTFGSAASPASTTVAGIIEIATNAEVIAATATNLAITPSGLKGAGYVRQFSATFLIAGFTANVLTVSAATHGLGATENIMVQVFDSTQQLVVTQNAVSAAGVVTITTNTNFDGHYVLQAPSA